MNLRLLRLVAIALSDAGILLLVLTLVLRLGLDSIVTVVATLLIAAGLILFLRWSALKAKVARK